MLDLDEGRWLGVGSVSVTRATAVPRSGRGRGRARVLLVGLVVALLAPTLVVASSQSAQAVVVPAIPVLPSVGAGLGGFEGVAGWGGLGAVATDGGYLAAAASVAASGVAVAGLGIGYGIGWTGVQGYGFLKDRFFTDHPPSVAGTSVGSCTPRAQPDLVDCTFTVPYSSGDVQLQLFPPGVAANLDGVGRCAKLVGGVAAGVPVTFTNPGYRCQVTAGDGTVTNFTPGSANLKYYPGGCCYVPGGDLTIGPPQAAESWRLRASVQCATPAGVITTVTAVSSSFSSSADAPSTSPAVGCPAGTTAVGGGVGAEKTVSGSPTVETVPGFNVGTRPQWTDPGQQYSKCLGLSGGTPCPLQPFQTTSTDPATGTKTYIGWDPVPNPSTGIVPDPQGCTWGPYVLTVAECGPVAQPPQPDPTTSPQPTGTATAQAPTFPTDEDTKDGSQCWPKGWGVLNPLEWVYKPVVCAGRALFVPKPATITRVEALPTEAAKHVPFSVISGGVGWLGGLSNINGHCINYRVTVGQFGAVTMLDTCTPGPVEGIVMGYRTLLGVVVFIGFFGPLLWWAWKQYAPATQASA